MYLYVYEYIICYKKLKWSEKFEKNRIFRYCEIYFQFFKFQIKDEIINLDCFICVYNIVYIYIVFFLGVFRDFEVWCQGFYG